MSGRAPTTTRHHLLDGLRIRPWVRTVVEDCRPWVRTVAAQKTLRHGDRAAPWWTPTRRHAVPGDNPPPLLGWARTCTTIPESTVIRPRSLLVALSAVLSCALITACSSGSGEATCEQDSVTYQVGDSVPAADCNTCSCSEDGSVLCTAMACGDPVCTEEDCGPALGMPNYMCPDEVTMAGPGPCEAQEDGTCGWTVIQCPGDLCADVTCPSSPGYCEGELAYSGTTSTCDPVDGECIIHPSAPPEDCAELDLTCIDGGCVLPPAACCASDDGCDDDKACAHAGDGQGTCQAQPDDGMCWTDAHCGDGETCEGAGFGTCLDEDSAAPQQGTCEASGPLPPTCCETVDDCDDGQVCADIGSTYKACKPAPTDGACWSDDDCDGGVSCEGASPCPCDVVCAEDKPGTCGAAPGDGCCGSDDDCDDGMACAHAGGGQGTCQAQPDDGMCWTDAHCADGEACTGAGFGTCLDEDSAAPQQGTCEAPSPLPPTCCETVDDCVEGQVCADIGGEYMACKPAPAEGSCWSDDDCGEGELCAGVIPCPCDVVCAQDSPGSCEAVEPLPDGCCETVDDCGPSQLCVDIGGTHMACKPKPAEGACWSDDDCGEAGICEGAAPCPCDAACIQDSPGVCAPTATACEASTASNLDGVSIEVTAATCTYTQAEAAAGISVPYEVIVASSVLGVSPWAQDAGGCGSPGPSGLTIFERLQGGDELYCMCDVGLCAPNAQMTTDLVPGSHAHAFEWDGVNWTGPSDFGNPQGAPFPPGSYTLDISAKGDVDGAEFEIKVAWPIHITE